MIPRHTLAAAMLIAAACGSRAAPAGAPLMFEDAEGRQVTVAPLPVRRIISIRQSETEWLVALGEAGRLVARTDFDHQPELASLPSIGGGLDPSPEAVAALKPDVILGWRNRTTADLEHALTPFHIPVLSFEARDTADVFRNLARLGALVGRVGTADSLANSLRGRLAAVRRDACPTRPDSLPTVLLVLSDEPPITAGGGTWMGTVLDAACLHNVFEDLTAAWPTISLEAIASRNPDWILTSLGKTPGQRLAEYQSKPGWRDLKAVRAGHIIEIPADLFSRSGPTIPDAARAIVDAKRAVEGH